jgi:biopolymer transport protein ExbD
MAHLFKKRKDEDETAIDLTPMLDVVFIMLIFFIVTASFVKEVGFDVNRPPPAPDTPPDNANKNAVLTVTENNEIWLEDRRIDVRSVRANVERILAENPDAAVIVRAHEQSDAKTYISIADAARDAVGPGFSPSLVTYDN